MRKKRVGPACTVQRYKKYTKSCGKVQRGGTEAGIIMHGTEDH